VTTTELSPVPVTVAQAGPRTRVVALVAAIVGAVTLVTRLALHRGGFDLYGDEIIYTALGRSVISGGFPRFEGGIFFLHGPAFLYLEAGWARLTGGPNNLIAWVYSMRMLNSLFAGGTAVVMVLLGTRVSSLRAGAAAGALFAADPFCIRQNDRVLLETSMMFWVLLGYLFFVSLVNKEPAKRDWMYAVGAGVLFGCAVLTKDEGALITVFPLVVAAIFGWGARRPWTLLTIGTAAAVYGVYVIVVAANGYFTLFWQTKTFGIQRLLGLIQITGFHSVGGGDLWARINSEAGVFWTTYFAVALAGPMMLLVLRYGSSRPRLLGLVYTAAALTLAYAVVFGTLEEQELYLLVLPSLLIIPVAIAELSRRRRPASETTPRWHARRVPAVAMITALAVTLGLNTATYVQWLRQPDNAFVRLYEYVTTHIPKGTALGAVSGDIDTLDGLGGAYQVGYWSTPAALSAAHAKYLVVLWASVTDGYSYLSPAQVDRLVGHDRPVFSAWGRTNGHVVLYRVPLSSGSVPHGRVLPPSEATRPEGMPGGRFARPPK
jgi:hypothetical protein